jgi:hypothetical protein
VIIVAQKVSIVTFRVESSERVRRVWGLRLQLGLLQGLQFNKLIRFLAKSRLATFSSISKERRCVNVHIIQNSTYRQVSKEKKGHLA